MIDVDAPVLTPAPHPGRSLRGRLLAVLAVVVVVGGAWLVFFSSAFAAKDVSVSGADAALAAEVRTAAAVGIGTPLVRLDTSAIAQRVRAVPAVASVSVHVSYPSTVRITVVPRVAVAYSVVGPEKLLFDATGVMFERSAARPKGLPSLTHEPGAVLTDADRRAAVAVAASLSASLRSKIDHMYAPDPNSVTLIMRTGKRVVWGNASAASAKSQLLTGLMSKNFSFVDLSEPGSVVTG